MPDSISKNRCNFKAIGIISIFFMLFFSTLPNSIKDVNATYEFPNYTEQNLLNDNPSVLPSQSSMEMWSGDNQLAIVLSEAWTTYICLKIDVYNVTPTDEDLSPELLSEWTVPINYQAYTSRYASGLGCVSMHNLGDGEILIFAYRYTMYGVPPDYNHNCMYWIHFNIITGVYTETHQSDGTWAEKYASNPYPMSSACSQIFKAGSDPDDYQVILHRRSMMVYSNNQYYKMSAIIYNDDSHTINQYDFYSTTGQIGQISYLYAKYGNDDLIHIAGNYVDNRLAFFEYDPIAIDGWFIASYPNANDYVFTKYIQFKSGEIYNGEEDQYYFCYSWCYPYLVDGLRTYKFVVYAYPEREGSPVYASKTFSLGCGSSTAGYVYYNAYFSDDEPEDVTCFIYAPNQISGGVVQSLSQYYCANFFTSQTFVLDDFVEDVKSEYGIGALYPYRYTSDYVTMPNYEGYGYYTEDYAQHKGYIWRYFIEGEPETTYDITMSYSPSGTMKTGTIYSFTAHAFVYNETFSNWDNYECKYEWYVDTNLISSGNSNSGGIFIKEFNFGSAGTHVFEIIIFDIEDVYYASPLYDETFNYLFYTSGGTEPPAGETPIVPPGGVTPIIPTGQGWMDMMTAILPPLVLLMGPTISLAKFGIIGIMVGLSAGVMVGVQMGYFPTYTYFMLILILSIGLVYMATHRG